MVPQPYHPCDFLVVGFIGQIAVLFYRTRQLEKRLDKQSDGFNNRFNASIYLIRNRIK